MRRSSWWLIGMVAVAIAAILVGPSLYRTAISTVASSAGSAPATVTVAPATVTVAPTPASAGVGQAIVVPAELGSVRAVAERVKPAVVQITTEQVQLDRLGRPVATGSGVGSGVIYDPRGLILTNNHVIADARSLTVSLPDGRAYPGQLVGGDPQMDLAVVRIEPRPNETLPVAALGNSEALAVGDWVVAIGNALGLPGGPTVTAGVVSAVGRAIQEPGETPDEPGPYLYDLIQTDAAINPGNSGGPLLNMAGEVIGINTLGAGGDGATIAQGIGFAIAVNTARPIADQLVASGRVTHPFMGIGSVLLTPALAAQLDLTVTQGVIVGQVVPGSPAARAGLRPRDVITAINNQPIVDETTLGRAINRRQPGDQLRLGVARGAERVTLEVTLGERPEQP